MKRNVLTPWVQGLSHLCTFLSAGHIADISKYIESMRMLVDVDSAQN